MKNKILTLALALVMLFTLTACGEKPAPEEPVPEEPSVEVIAPVEEIVLPVVEIVAPTEETAAPVEEIAAPAEAPVLHHEQPAAPAPLMTTRTSAISFLTTLSALMRAEATTMAVPC